MSDYYIKQLDEKQQKLVKKVLNKKRLKKLSILGEYVEGLKGIVDYPTLNKQRKPLVKGISIPSKSKIESRVEYALLDLLGEIVGGEKQTAKMIPLNDFGYKYKESDKSLKDDEKYHEWSMILAKKNSKRLGFSLGDLLFRIQTKKNEIIVYPEMRAFDRYEYESIFEGISYFLTDEDMYKVSGDKYNVIRG